MCVWEVQVFGGHPGHLQAGFNETTCILVFLITSLLEIGRPTFKTQKDHGEQNLH